MVKNTESNHKNEEIAKLNADTADAKTDLSSNLEELDAAVAYFEKLKPSCVDTNVRYSSHSDHSPVLDNEAEDRHSW